MTAQVSVSEFLFSMRQNWVEFLSGSLYLGNEPADRIFLFVFLSLKTFFPLMGFDDKSINPLLRTKDNL